MKNRVKKFKPPLPSFSSCAIDGSSSGMLSKDGRAAEIHHGQSWVKGTTCQRVGGDNRRYRPSGCTGSGYYAEVYSDGKQMGETYYFMP
ncbi:hypothetical protein [Candidatus Sororendozoicomonas aggregata]|uniref:hypothetical protein n=1 Tax=Candidatus Sororendozoicomonas aggregata TaxID=3073239 RepID=UPI002ED1DF1D